MKETSGQVRFTSPLYNLVAGLFSVRKNMRAVTIDNVAFKNNSGTLANIIYMNSHPVKFVSIVNSVIEDNYMAQDDVQKIALGSSQVSFNKPSMIKLIQCGGVVIDRCTIKNIHRATKGAFLDIS